LNIGLYLWNDRKHKTRCIPHANMNVIIRESSEWANSQELISKLFVEYARNLPTSTDLPWLGIQCAIQISFEASFEILYEGGKSCWNVLDNVTVCCAPLHKLVHLFSDPYLQRTRYVLQSDKHNISISIGFL